MTPEQEIKVLDNAAIFLNRTNLSGDEVLAFNEVAMYLTSRRQGLAAALATANGQQEDVVGPPKPAED